MSDDTLLTPPDEPYAFVNLGDSDICITFNCDCGGQEHRDGFFTYEVTCEGCGKTFKFKPFMTVEVSDE